MTGNILPPLSHLADYGDERLVVIDSEGNDLRCGIAQLARDTRSEIERLQAKVERLNAQLTAAADYDDANELERLRSDLTKIHAMAHSAEPPSAAISYIRGITTMAVRALPTKDTKS